MQLFIRAIGRNGSGIETRAAKCITCDGRQIPHADSTICVCSAMFNTYQFLSANIYRGMMLRIIALSIKARGKYCTATLKYASVMV